MPAPQLQLPQPGPFLHINLDQLPNAHDSQPLQGHSTAGLHSSARGPAAAAAGPTGGFGGGGLGHSSDGSPAGNLAWGSGRGGNSSSFGHSGGAAPAAGQWGELLTVVCYVHISIGLWIANGAVGSMLKQSVGQQLRKQGDQEGFGKGSSTTTAGRGAATWRCKAGGSDAGGELAGAAMQTGCHTYDRKQQGPNPNLMPRHFAAQVG